MVLQGNVLTDAAVDNAFHLTQFLGRNLLEVREVEAQVVGRYERTLLFNVGAKHFAQSLVEQVRSRVVRLAAAACLFVDQSAECSFGLSRQFLVR